MNKIVVSAIIAIAAIAGNGADCNAGTISKNKTKKVSTFFSKVLNGENASYNSNDRIKPGDVANARDAVWACWRNAVLATNEEKLLAPFATNEPRDTGYWRLPEHLEDNALMPYYFIKKVNSQKTATHCSFICTARARKTASGRPAYAFAAVMTMPHHCTSFRKSPMDLASSTVGQSKANNGLGRNCCALHL